ncbi:putative non-specific serine/threonine protein kinase [Helianthus annuus]|uniref:receptor-like protein 51 n=1 Tax=Helianthus annuus TaxID=4232 RepID=UPI000B8FF721|nr:receptor-like protein 51 [Helianthus annuus]KAJ0475929.1 putative non-specific serine/threonine protein kinase [Helianthus annuus]KAJ0496730.1 putative non-specific serine/threonine protein kinase [Helianthus annuus]KAJ0662774.1 putative non-specific serine/threonine protein kinase [Helianthus annuus]KAJ0670287.1 putative non-specific serine/threonine protein kinase [Helianthus annuus]
MCAHAGMIVTAVVGLWGWTAVSLSASSLLMFIRCSSKEPGYVKTFEGIRNNADAEGPLVKIDLINSANWTGIIGLSSVLLARLEDAGYAVGVRVLELLCHREKLHFKLIGFWYSEEPINGSSILIQHSNAHFMDLCRDLRGNRLSGQIPDEIGDCKTLKNLDLSFNMLAGDIPFLVSKLKQLELFLERQLINRSDPYNVITDS